MTFVRVIGVKQLNARLEAMKPNRPMMEKLGLTAIAEQKRIAPVRTGNYRRGINIGRIGKTYVDLHANADYSAYVEYNTQPHTIVPRRARVLRFKIGNMVVWTRRVRHPGTKGQHVMERGARRAIEILFGSRSRDNIVIDRWDDAA